MQIIIFFYNTIMILVLLACSPIFLFLIAILPGWREGINSRFGIFPENLKDKIRAKPNIWFHSASVGESKCIIPLAKRIQAKYGNYQLVFSTTSLVGRKIIEKYFQNPITFYLPLDIFMFVNKVVRLVTPKVLIATETEIWPMLFYSVKRRNGKIVVVNGRFSKESLKRYKIIATTFFKKVLQLVDVFGMRTEEDARLVKELGANLANVIVTGDLKYETFLIDETRYEEVINLIKPLCGANVIVAGSVHLSEVETLLLAFKDVVAKIKDSTLIIAPRFLEEVNDMEKLILKYNFRYIKRSIAEGKEEKFNVVILDSIGELNFLYKIATIAFVGGSLTNIGGHNMLEPVFWGKPVIFGPFIQHFSEVAEEIKRSSLGFVVNDKKELADKILELLQNRHLLIRIETESRQFMEKRKGSVYRNLQIVERFLE